MTEETVPDSHPEGTPTDEERKVEEIAARYLDRLKAGLAPSKDALLADHPEVSARLSERLAEVEKAHEEASETRLTPRGLPPAGAEGMTTTRPTIESDRARRAEPPGPVGPDDSTVGVEGPDCPSRVGPYKVLEVLGEGGMGSVFLAAQTEPVRRKVALKLIKLGMDTKEVIGRFESERQALALMEHPNIAKVFDAGATATGRPYFVMEHVPGIPLADYCDQNRLTVRERLDLFIGICEAVQHAHQKGIIHRDLKPSNILVTVPNSHPVPKIIDFGIAKATSQRLTERTVFTEQGRLIGTPEYMSPEQADVSALDVDTRTDIYSLGVILYRLLVGALPFESKDLRGAGYEEIRRKIREEEPSKPSTRLSGLGKDSQRVAERRRADTASLRRQLRGDLDWITMKALEKDRTRRYATASELAADIGRHLADEPVLAGPPSATYRLGKFVRKNRVVVAATAAVAAALVAGLAVSLTLYFQAVEAREAEAAERAEAVRQREAARVAEAKAQEERDAAEAARTRETEQRGLAESAQETAEAESEKAQAINRFLREMLSSVDPGKEGRDVRVVDILDRAALGIDAAFPDQPLVEAGLRETVGSSYQALGLYPRAEPHLRKALDIRRAERGEDHPETLLSKNDLALLRQLQGRFDEADALFREALETARRTLGEDHADTLAYLANLAGHMGQQGKYEEAEPLLRKALEGKRRILGDDHTHTIHTVKELADLLRKRGKLDECEALCREAVEACRRTLGDDHPYTLFAMNSLADLLWQRGRFEEAEEIDRRTLAAMERAMGEDHPETIAMVRKLGVLLRDRGKLDEAAPLFRRALEADLRMQGEDHPETLHSLNNLAALLMEQGKLDEAEPLLRTALEARLRTLGEDHPETVTSMNNLASLLKNQGKLEEAEPLLRKGLEARRRAVGEDHPDTLVFLSNLAGALRDQGKLDEAEPMFRTALDGFRRALGDDHPNTLILMDLLAGLLQDRGKFDQAESLYRRALASTRRLLGEDHPATLTTTNNLATLLQRQGKLDEAERLCRKAVEGRRRVLGEDHPVTLTSMSNLAALLNARGKPGEAEPLFRSVLEGSRRVLGEDHPDTLVRMNNLAAVLGDLGKLDEALDLAGRAEQIAESALPDDDWRAAEVRARYAHLLIQAGRFEEAESQLLRAFPCLRASLGLERRETLYALEGLVKLYEAWGKAEDAEEYRALLEPSEEPAEKESDPPSAE